MNEQQLTHLTSRLIGETVGKMWLAYGSMIHIEFGPVGANEWGNWAFVSLQCMWRLEQASRVITASEDVGKIISEKIKILEGMKLQEFKVELPYLDGELVFENDKGFKYRLKLFALHSLNADEWSLKTPERSAITATAGKGLTDREANQA